MKQLLLAFQFLTIIPVRTNMTISETDIAKSSSAFVIVGIIQGILLISVNSAAGMVFDRNLVTGLILLVLVLSQGGFHLDGLADTFDAIAVRGDKEKKLSVMKDSAVGPIGAIAIFFSLLLKFFALNNLNAFSPHAFYFSLFLMPIFSKWALVVSIFHGKPARKNGLGRIFINRIGFKEVAISTLLLLFSCISVQIFFDDYMLYRQYILYVILVILTYLLCMICIWFFNNKFGGLTGDMLGAISEITEITFLLMVIAWSQFSI